MKKKASSEDLDLIIAFKKSPLPFIRVMWGLIPQPINPIHQEEVSSLIKNKQFNEIKKEHFLPFIRGRHITWQQWLITLAVEEALTAKGKKRISVASGHGIGKSSLLSMLIIWFLYSFPCSNVPCTAPTGDQLQGALWKELAVWLSKMPEQEAERFELQLDHLRVHDPAIRDSGRMWWARARTGKKENPEALAGVHSKHGVMAVVDEASGVHDKVFEVMEGALTEDNIIVLMISNYTRNIGYFHNSHTKHKHMWHTFSFSSIDSPIPSDGYAEQIEALYGRDGDEYRIRVLGLPPRESAVDDKGYVPLFRQKDVIQIDHVSDDMFISPLFLGVDPAGEGVDKSTWVLRDNFKAKVILEEKISNPKQLALRTVGLMEYFNITQDQVFVDMFGTGSEFIKEMALAGYDLKSLMVGERPDDDADKDLYLNKRACYYFRMKQWLREGGELIMHPSWEEELISLRYRRGMSGKMQMMSKKDMKSAGYRSPNSADALMLTFAELLSSTPVKTFSKSARMSHYDKDNNAQNNNIARRTSNNLHGAI